MQKITSGQIKSIESKRDLRELVQRLGSVTRVRELLLTNHHLWILDANSGLLGKWRIGTLGIAVSLQELQRDMSTEELSAMLSILSEYHLNQALQLLTYSVYYHGEAPKDASEEDKALEEKGEALLERKNALVTHLCTNHVFMVEDARLISDDTAPFPIYYTMPFDEHDPAGDYRWQKFQRRIQEQYPDRSLLMSPLDLATLIGMNQDPDYEPMITALLSYESSTGIFYDHNKEETK